MLAGACADVQRVLAGACADVQRAVVFLVRGGLPREMQRPRPR